MVTNGTMDIETC